MKKDLATSVVAAIVGVLVAYFLCNMFLQAPADVTFSTINASTTYTLNDPNPEVFNYRAINPTVEVYVGQCAEYNQYGDCIENITIEDLPDQDIEIEEEIIDQTDEGTETVVDQDQTEDTQDGTTD